MPSSLLMIFDRLASGRNRLCPTLAAVIALGFISACSGSESLTSSPAPAPTPGPATSGNPTVPIGEQDTPSECGPLPMAPYPSYFPLMSVYSDPNEVLLTSDIKGTLSALRAVASPTQEYHLEILRLLEDARSIDKDHLVMLAQAAFLTATDEARIARELQETFGKNDLASCLKKQKALRDQQTLQTYSVFSDMLLAEGVRKVSSLTTVEAKEILGEVLPTGGGSAVFFNALQRLSPLDESDLLAFIQLATQKRAAEAAGQLSLNWFRRFSDHGFQTLVDFCTRLSGRAKDLFLLGAFTDFRFFSLDQILALAVSGHEQNGVIAGRAFTRVEGFSHEKVQVVVNALMDRHRGDFLSLVIRQYREISAADLLWLLTSTTYRRSEIALLAQTSLKEASAEDIVKIADQVSGFAKDELILHALHTSLQSQTVTAQQVLALMNASYQCRLEIAMAQVAKIENLLTDEALQIASSLTGLEKDRFLLTAVDIVTDLNDFNLRKLSQAAVEAGIEIQARGETRL